APLPGRGPLGGGRETRYLATVAIAIAVAMAGALLLFLARRRRPAAAPVPPLAPLAPAAPAPIDDETARLARTIAELDAEFERRASPTPEERAAYDARRMELKHALARALDARRQHV
ncbi:MAG: hypothetical protein IRY91_11500, partial [Gemmatimonadaceae bacterium]|nr:hypothetical protein [Gemmatimonadaceae bacterium]